MAVAAIPGATSQLKNGDWNSPEDSCKKGQDTWQDRRKKTVRNPEWEDGVLSKCKVKSVKTGVA